MREESEFVLVGVRHSNYTIMAVGFVITDGRNKVQYNNCPKRLDPGRAVNRARRLPEAESRCFSNTVQQFDSPTGSRILFMQTEQFKESSLKG
jgi:hypothetical protein